jgi:hypothetical protein
MCFDVAQNDLFICKLYFVALVQSQIFTSLIQRQAFALVPGSEATRAFLGLDFPLADSASYSVAAVD